MSDENEVQNFIGATVKVHVGGSGSVHGPDGKLKFDFVMSTPVETKGEENGDTIIGGA